MKAKPFIVLAWACTPLANAQHLSEIGMEFMNSDDVSLRLKEVRYTYTAGDWTSAVQVSLNEIDIDFEPAPFDLLGTPTQISSNTWILASEAQKRIGNDFRLELAAAYRNGFSNYREAWLDTYFEQHFSVLDRIPGSELYQDTGAEAFSGSAGVRWEYLPTSGFATLAVTQIQDNVSPGYEIDFDGIRRSSLVLATTALNLTVEQVTTPRIRARLSLTASKTSERSWRYSTKFAANLAIGEYWILRTVVGGSEEGERFSAGFFQLDVERQLTQSLSIYAQARRYQDSGEIEDAFLFTTAAPRLASESATLGFKFAQETWNLRLHISTTDNKYTETNPRIDFFQNLYRSRIFEQLNVAFGKSF